MTFTGDPIDASSALAWGLVSRVVPDADLLAEATGLAKRIAANPPLQLRMSKRLLREAQNVRFDTLLEMASGLQSLCHFTQDHEEAVLAFFEKRPPSFTGE
jgi:enoyl-CoA hydratase/carnithine racemase